MAPAPQSLPTRFPCWVRAVYSWGGESKRDLGFVEGDLIECLNAGDGSWWMGRLRRDKRMIGLFPSNFVEVLDDSFRPASRVSSPMPERTPSPNPSNPPQKTKSKAYRRPFEAYSAPDQAALKRAELKKQDSLLSSRSPSPNPATMFDNNPQVPPTLVPGYGSRVPSPAPPMHAGSRAPSPAPSFHASYQYQAYSREPSPQPDISSTPPPPPPPHRSVYAPDQSTNSYNLSNGYHTPRATSPAPPSPGGDGLTPSPLRSAMDDIMSSLADMGMSRTSKSPEPSLGPWSPEAFDQTYAQVGRNNLPRPHSAMDVGQNDYDGYNVVQPSRDYPDNVDRGPPVPSKTGSGDLDRPKSSMGRYPETERKLRHRKSAYEVGRSMLGRTFTTKTNSTSSSSGTRSTTTNGSSGTQLTDKSIMSGPSAGGFSSTSAGSLARKKEAFYGRAHSAFGTRKDNFLATNESQVNFGNSRPQTPLTGITYHSSHASGLPRSQSQAGWNTSANDSSSMLGGLVAPKPKKSGFFKKILESAKTGAASARSSFAVADASNLAAPSKNMIPSGVSAIAGGHGNIYGRDAASDMGLGGGKSGIDWVQVRRDVNRSNSLSQIEMIERKERCQMMDYPAISPVDELYESCDGDEGADGNPILEPTNFQAVNLSLVDKNARFINSLPPMTNPVSLSTGFVCRPYRSDVQRLRAIFTWVSEKITWEEGLESDIDPKRVIQTKRGCAEEVAVLVLEMCAAVGIHAEIVRGYLKSPGEVPEVGLMPRPNHWWNAVIVDRQWRIMDCSLAAPSHPRRAQFSSVGGQQAEFWWFLARPSEICWTHVPEQHYQQHLCPPMAHEVLLALPCACPPYFKNSLQMVDYDTSMIRIEDLELAHIKFTAPSDVECVAEVEARAFQRDADGDFFESGDIVKKPALAQAEWVGGQKRYTVKALLPGDEGHGTLKVYAGKRGLMHSIKDIPHPVAFTLPLLHTGDNPPYEFLKRHPTPHAQRHDLYVAQPQCQFLAVNNTFVFAVRQHPSSLSSALPNGGGTSPVPFIRPGSAMSITNSSASGSNPSTSNYSSSGKKPAKLAIQAPGGKILRLMRKEERGQSLHDGGDGGTWETIIKCGERGVWRGLVLADRSARWCVFAEWTCV